MRVMGITVGAVLLLAGPLAMAAPDTAPPTPRPSQETVPAQDPVDAPREARVQPNTKRVAARIRARAPVELLTYFDTVLYVSKAASGPWAQRMFVFKRDTDGTLTLTDSFRVSTGREREEQYFTRTPTGVFELDPNRIHRMARSRKWRNAPMPYAMFLNYAYRTDMSGVALHSATGRDIARLGLRASGGCIRLPPDKAAALFESARSARTQVPRLVFDEDRGTTNREGLMVRDAEGRPVLTEGIPILVVVEDYPGREPADTVALRDERV